MKELLLILTILSTNAMALTVECELKESTGFKKIQIHELDLHRHGPMNPFETDLTNGFISSSRGHLTVSPTHKSTNITNNFYGAIQNSEQGVGGNILYSPSEWIQVDCNAQK